MRRTTLTFLSFLISLLAAPGVVAQRQTVALDVRADSELQTTVESFLGRELRSLNDVTVVSDQAASEAQIHAIVGYAKDRADRERLGWVLAITFTRTRTCQKQVVMEAVGSMLRWGKTVDELKDTVVSVVAEFDNTVLQPNRKNSRQ